MPSFSKIILLGGLLGMGIITNYFTSEIISSLYFVCMLIAYFRSTDEAFWLVFFLLLSDGFFGFFGLYEVVIQVIPGLPPIEAGQLYIILTIVKAARLKNMDYRPFMTIPLIVLAIYIGFLLVQGHVLGLSTAINVQFRIVKWLLPLGLLYSLPRLFLRKEQYHELFGYLFMISFTVIIAQVFTIMTSQTPPQFFGVQQEAWFAIKVSAEKTYRGLYNDSVILLSYCGALFFLAHKKPPFSSLLLFGVIVANFGSVFLSATRGWTIALTFSLIFSTIFALRFNLNRMMIIGFVLILFAISAKSIPIIGIQLENAVERMLTLNKLAEGDLTAGGTLIRLSQRGPRVMGKWKESPLTGWGYSDGFMEYNDFHVGNQNILLHSGILGAALMAWFFLYFCFKLFIRYLNSRSSDEFRKSILVLIIFVVAWFLLHSSSEQLFSYYQEVGPGMVIGIFFSFSALVYHLSIEENDQELVENLNSP